MFRRIMLPSSSGSEYHLVGGYKCFRGTLLSTFRVAKHNLVGGYIQTFQRKTLPQFSGSSQPWRRRQNVNLKHWYPASIPQAAKTQMIAISAFTTVKMWKPILCILLNISVLMLNILHVSKCIPIALINCKTCHYSKLFKWKYNTDSKIYMNT
jgi:hypothetical protein